MSVVASPVVRRMVQVASAPVPAQELLASVGLSPEADPSAAMRQAIDSEAYYGLVEWAVRDADAEFPFRYADVLRPDDLAALGLALKTARNVGDALGRLAPRRPGADRS